MTTYRARVRAEAVSPVGDTLDAPYRLLSVGTMICSDSMGRRSVVEIPEDVLRASLPLFQPRADTQGHIAGPTVYADHDVSARAWCGQVVEAHWSEAKGAVPAGIDGTIRWDRVADPRVFRGVETGALRAVSAGFDHAWRMSHELDLEAFAAQMGRPGPDGQIVRRIATSIEEVYEISAVWDGADPYARRLAAARIAAEGDQTMPDQTAPEVKVEIGGDEEKKGGPMAELCDLLGCSEEEIMPTIKALQEKAGMADSMAEEAKKAKCEAARWVGQDLVPRPELAAVTAQPHAERTEQVWQDAIRGPKKLSPARVAAMKPLMAGQDIEKVRALIATFPDDTDIPGRLGSAPVQAARPAEDDPCEPTELEIARGKIHGQTRETLRAAKASLRKAHGYQD